MPTTDPPNGLSELSSLIARKETTGDVGFFCDLLAPEFAMRRAKLETYVGRDGFLEALESSFERRTCDVRVLLETETIAVTRCTVVRVPDDLHFDNVRIFVRPSAAVQWKLLAWANELLSSDPKH